MMGSILQQSAVFRERASKIMKANIERVCPEKYLSSMFMVDVESSVEDVFNELNYHPHHLKKAIDRAWGKSKREDKLSEFVYKVWRFDNGH